MLIFITVLMLNVWAISADDTPNINILEELKKIKTMETKMKSLETEIEQLRTENKEQAKELKTLYDTTIDTKIKMDELIKQNQAPKLAFSAGVLTLFGPQSVGPCDNERVKVAFSATLSALGHDYKFIGPYTTAFTLVYENELTNIGNAYDKHTGIFTAPVKGVYYFNFVVFNPHAMSTGVNLLKNGNFVVGATDNPPGLDTEDTAGNAVSLLLDQGDKVYLQLWENRRIYTDGNRRNTFSGHLLFTM